MNQNTFNLKSFLLITLITSIWINASDVFRYFMFVMPRMKEFFPGRNDIAKMDWEIFSIWGLWDTLLTASLVFITFLFVTVFGNSLKSIFSAATMVWLAIFMIFWVATANMGLSNWSILWITLPLSWAEMVIGAWLANKLFVKYKLSLNYS